MIRYLVSWHDGSVPAKYELHHDHDDALEVAEQCLSTADVENDRIEIVILDTSTDTIIDTEVVL